MNYADSNYASDTKNKQLIIGYIYYLNKATVSKLSKIAKTITLFLIEEKYIMSSHISK